MNLGGWRVQDNLGGIGGRQNIIRTDCIKKKTVFKKKEKEEGEERENHE